MLIVVKCDAIWVCERERRVEAMVSARGRARERESVVCEIEGGGREREMVFDHLGHLSPRQNGHSIAPINHSMKLILYK